MSYKGTLSFVDIGTGRWTLTTARGETMELFGEIPSNLAGREVTVKGKAIAAHGLGMLGGKKGIEVSSVEVEAGT